MQFSWDESQLRRFAEIEDYAQAFLQSDIRTNDRESTFDRDSWQKLGEAGILGAHIPKEFGGQGLDPLTVAGLLERLGFACLDNGLLFSASAQMWTAALPILKFGTAEQKARLLPELCSGRLVGGNATTEKQSGSDALNVGCIATKRGDTYVLRGHKMFVTNAPIADIIIVLARDDSQSLSAFIVEKAKSNNITIKIVDKMGLRTSPMGEMVFEDCEVSAANRLGREGAGSTIFTHFITWERGFILAPALGTMRRLLMQCIDEAKKRKRFGKSIGDYQSVTNRIVDMKLRLDTSRLLLYQHAAQRSNGKIGTSESSATKLFVSESWVNTCQDAIQVFGGYGYLTETGLERELRDALGSKIYSGTNEVQRNIIASLLGLRP